MLFQMFTLICVLIALQYIYYQIKWHLKLTMTNGYKEKIFSGIFSGIMAIALSLYAIETHFEIYFGLGVMSLILCLIYSGTFSFGIGYFMYGFWSYVPSFIEPAFNFSFYILIGLFLTVINAVVKDCNIYTKGMISLVTLSLIFSGNIYLISHDPAFVIKTTILYLTLTTISLFIGIAMVRYMQRYVELYNKMQFQATHDGLTEVLNRRSFDDCINKLNPEDKVSLLMMDIDKFKNINDRYGHSTGDSVLINVARTIESVVKDKRSIARTGGEEFAVILRNRDLEEAVIIAEKLRNAVEYMELEEGNRVINVTMSIGIASYPLQAASTERLYELADTKLYIAKKRGRNQIYYKSLL